LEDRKPSCVFNLVEPLHGRGELISLVPALLESASIPFTGSGSDAITLSSQKILAKRWMRRNEITTPRWHSAGEFADGREDENRTWIVKSLWEHASLGIDDGSVVRGRAAAEQRIRECVDNCGGSGFAEVFVVVRDVNSCCVAT